MPFPCSAATVFPGLRAILALLFRPVRFKKLFRYARINDQSTKRQAPAATAIPVAPDHDACSERLQERQEQYR
jgi:hypothetical protein